MDGERDHQNISLHHISPSATSFMPPTPIATSAPELLLSQSISLLDMSNTLTGSQPEQSLPGDGSLWMS